MGMNSETPKFWASVGRVDNAYGDRNLICTCPSIESYADTLPENEESSIT